MDADPAGGGAAGPGVNTLRALRAAAASHLASTGTTRRDPWRCGAGERVSADADWSGTCASRGLGVLGSGVGLLVTALGIFVVVLATGAPAVGWVLVGLGALVALLAWWASRLRVVVDAGSIQVAWGPTGWPRKRIRWDRVRDVSAIQVEPDAVGRLGLPLDPVGPTRAPRSCAGGRASSSTSSTAAFVVTVDDAVAGARPPPRRRGRPRGPSTRVDHRS